MKTSGLVQIRDLIHSERRPSFIKEIDLYGLDDGVVIGVTGCLGLGFMLEPQDLLLKNAVEIEDYEKRMRRFLNSVPEGLRVHFVVRSRAGDEAVLSEYSESIGVKNSLTQKFIQAKIESYRQRPFLKREVFLFIVIHPHHEAVRSSLVPDLSFTFGKKSHRLNQHEYESSRNSLLTAAGEIADGFRDLGFGVRPLGGDEILRYLYGLLNPTLSEECYPFDPDQFQQQDGADPSTLRSKLLLSAPRVGDEYFNLDGLFHRCLNLLQPPESTDLRVVKQFEDSLGKDYFFSLVIESPNQEKERGLIRRQGNFARAKGFYSRTKDHDAITREIGRAHV